jgi:hypothetical protein
VFDLDATLADLSHIQHTIMSKNTREDYTNYVYECAMKEISNTPIGFLRPGLVKTSFLPLDFTPYMEQILELKRKGICQGVIIYSNNDLLKSLRFVRDVIHVILGVNDLFCHCIHRTYPGRKQEYNPPKTWIELKSLLENQTDINNHCDISDFEPSNVIFFDDIVHSIQNELGDNYIQVDEYNNIFYNTTQTRDFLYHRYMHIIDQDLDTIQDAIDYASDMNNTMNINEEHTMDNTVGNTMNNSTYSGGKYMSNRSNRSNRLNKTVYRSKNIRRSRKQRKTQKQKYKKQTNYQQKRKYKLHSRRH